MYEVTVAFGCLSALQSCIKMAGRYSKSKSNLAKAASNGPHTLQTLAGAFSFSRSGYI